MTTTPGINSGHGYVYPRPDGVKARCGGPAICPECAKDFVQIHTMITGAAAGDTQPADYPSSAAPASAMTKRELIAAMASRWRYRDERGELQPTFTDWGAYRPGAES